jgi:transposase
MGYRRYTAQFKVEALELLKSSGKSASQVERELGITPGLLGKWRQPYRVGNGPPPVSLEPSELASAQAEIGRLKRELAVVSQERDILKKAVAIFSQERE